MKNLRNRNAPPNADLVQVYLESSWDIVTAVYGSLAWLENIADAIAAGDLQDFLAIGDIDTLAKLNAIVTDATLGDASDFATAAQGALADNSMQLPIASQGEAEAGVDNVKPMTALRTAQAIAILAAGIQHEYAGLAAPGVNDDTLAGFSAGSTWFDTSVNPDEIYRCIDPTAAAAVWIKTSLTIDELALVASTGNSDDLIEGAAKLLMTVAERNKLTGIESGATGDLTGAEIKTLYEGEADTNAFTDLLIAKLNGIEAAAQVNVALASQAEAEAGVEATKTMTALRVAQAIALGGGAGGLAAVYKDAAYVASAADYIMADTATNGIWTLTLPAGPSLNDLVIIRDCTGNCGQAKIIIDGDGADTINSNLTFDLNHPYAEVALIWDGTEWVTGLSGMFIQGPTEHMTFALSDETSDLAVLPAALTTRTPYEFFLTGVRAHVNVAPVGAAIEVDINDGGISILTSPLTIDDGEKTSTTSVVSNPMGITVTIFGDDDELVFDIDQVGVGTPGKGLKVTLIGYRTQI